MIGGFPTLAFPDFGFVDRSGSRRRQLLDFPSGTPMFPAMPLPRQIRETTISPAGCLGQIFPAPAGVVFFISFFSKTLVPSLRACPFA